MAQEEITLSMSEVLVAAMVGVMRRIQDLKLKRNERYGCSSSEGWQTNIEGAIGEAVVAKYLDRWWSGALGDLHAADVGNGRVQVRTTAHSDGHLIVHPKDRDEDIFILCVGTAPNFVLAGWTSGLDAKSEMFWRDPKGGRPAYFVPQRSLQPMAALACLSLSK